MASGDVGDRKGERDALVHARDAVRAKIDKLSGIADLPERGGADAIADEYIDAVVRGACAFGARPSSVQPVSSRRPPTPRLRSAAA